MTTSAALSSNLKAINATSGTVENQPAGFAALGHADFLKLMVAQLQQQDPMEPVDNKDMLAQMAQFSALAGSSETNATLAEISGKLDALIAAQAASETTGQSTGQSTGQTSGQTTSEQEI